MAEQILESHLFCDWRPTFKFMIMCRSSRAILSLAEFWIVFGTHNTRKTECPSLYVSLTNCTNITSCCITASSSSWCNDWIWSQSLSLSLPCNQGPIAKYEIYFPRYNDSLIFWRWFPGKSPLSKRNGIFVEFFATWKVLSQLEYSTFSFSLSFLLTWVCVCVCVCVGWGWWSDLPPVLARKKHHLCLNFASAKRQGRSKIAYRS